MIGQIKKFKYHCLQSEKSTDVKLYHRTGQQVKILKIVEKGIGKTKKERLKEGTPRVYSIQFKDGFLGEAFEDELI